MSIHLTEIELIETVDALTSERLTYYRNLRIIVPTETAEGARYREIDIRRVSLLCELTDDMDLNEDALVIVMSLLDQLHGTRSRLTDILKALEEEDAHIRERIAGRLVG